MQKIHENDGSSKTKKKLYTQIVLRQKKKQKKKTTKSLSQIFFNFTMVTVFFTIYSLIENFKLYAGFKGNPLFDSPWNVIQDDLGDINIAKTAAQKLFCNSWFFFCRVQFCRLHHCTHHHISFTCRDTLGPQYVCTLYKNANHTLLSTLCVPYYCVPHPIITVRRYTVYYLWFYHSIIP